MTAAAARRSTDPAHDCDAHARGLYIGGHWRPAGQGRTIPVVDPSTEDELTAVADATVEDALQAVDAADAAAKSWRQTPPRKRAEILRRCFELMVERAEELAHLVSLENGKALSDARGEIAYAAEFFRWNSEEAARIGGRTRPRAGRRLPHPGRLRADRHRGADHALEFPGRNGDPQDRAGVRGRLHRHPEAGERDAADGLRAGGALRGSRCAAGRRQRDHHLDARAGHGRHAGRSAGAQTVVHRLDGGRPHAAGGSRQDRRQLRHGAWRQRAFHRLRRRRSRCGPRRRHGGQDAQCRRGLHGRQPVLRAIRHPRRLRRGTRGPHGRASGRARHRPASRAADP